MSKKQQEKNARMKNLKPPSTLGGPEIILHQQPEDENHPPTPLFQTSSERALLTLGCNLDPSGCHGLGYWYRNRRRTKGVWLRNVDIPKIFIDQLGYGFMSTCDQAHQFVALHLFSFFFLLRN